MQIEKQDLSGRTWYKSTDGNHFSWCQDEEPTEVDAIIATRSGVLTGATSTIKLADLDLVRIVRCGPINPETGNAVHPVRNSWTTCEVLGLYVRKPSRSGEMIDDRPVITQWHGGGQFLYVLNALDAAPAFRTLAQLDEHMVWDILHVIVNAYAKGKDVGSQQQRTEVEEAFLEGRLKRRTRDGKSTMLIESRFEKQAREERRARRQTTLARL